MPDKPRIYAWFTEARVTYWLKLLLLVGLGMYLLGTVLTFLARIEAIAIILIASVFLAYLLYPAVRLLNRRLSLIISILVVYGLLFILLILGVWFVLPALAREIAHLVRVYPSGVAAIRAQVENPASPIFGHFPGWMRNYIADIPLHIQTWVRLHTYDAAIGALALVTGTVTVIAALVIVPVISAYLLMDSENLKRYLIAMIPRGGRERSLDILSELEQVIGGFIRGQILVGASVGVLITVMLLIMHVQYALLIGLSAAVLDIVPYVGAVVAFIPAVLLALFHNGPTNALIVAALFVAIFQVEGHFIAPNIVSKSVSLSPLAVLLAILIGGELMGVVGMFIAVPVAGMLRVVAFQIMPRKASIAEAQPALTEEAREPAAEETPAAGLPS